MTRNEPNLATNLLSGALRRLRETLPSTWQVVERAIPPGAPSADTLVDLEAPNGQRVALVIEVKPEINPRDVPRLLESLRDAAAVPFVAARFLTPMTRRRLAELGSGYADTAGNFRLSLDDPPSSSTSAAPSGTRRLRCARCTR